MAVIKLDKKGLDEILGRTGVKISEKDYVRALELFAVIHEEIGEAQKAYNDLVWKGQGCIADIMLEFGQIGSPLEELMNLLENCAQLDANADTTGTKT